MRKTAGPLLLLATLSTLLLCSCQQPAPSTDSAVSMSDLQKTMLAADASLPEMLSVDSSTGDAARLFTYVSELPYDKVKSFFLSYSATAKADEVAVVMVKNAGDAEAAAATLRTHVQKRIQLFEQYEPDEAARAEKAQVFTQEQYAVLIISENAQAIKTAFENAIHTSS